MSKLKVYLAGPITGCTYGKCVTWRDFVKETCPEFDFIDPMRAKEYLSACDVMPAEYAGENPFKRLMSSSKGIMARDFWDCRRTDIILANLEHATEISIGTLFEIAWGKAFQKPTIVVENMHDLHDHPFVREGASHLCPNLDIALQVLKCIG